MKRTSIIAYAGYFLVMMTSFVLIVILVEFDILGNRAKHPENYREGTFVMEDGTPFLVQNSGERYELLRTKPGDFPADSLVFSYSLPGTQTAIPDFRMPHIPRGPHDVAITMVILVACMALVAGNPHIAYYDFLRHV